MNESTLWEAEASVVGGMLIDFPRCKGALLELMPSEFYSEDMQLAFERIKAIDERGERVDFVAVLSEMGDTAEYRVSLARAVDMVPSLSNYEAYINIVRNEAQRRRIVDQIQEMVYYNHSGSELLSRLREIVESEQSQDTAYREDMMLYKLGEYRGKLYEGAKTEKTKTGYSNLDQLLGGLAPKNFTVIGARPAMGKTAFAGCLAINLVESGRKVDFFSIEMSDDQLFDRLGANKQSIDHNRLRDGKTTKQENQAIISSLMALTEDKNFYLFDDIESIERIESIVAKNRPDIVIIDYLQLVTTGIAYREMREQVSHVSRACKRIAKKYNCHVIALAQLSRDVEKRKNKIPMLSDLKECGQIEQDADAVMFLFREYVYNKNKPPEPTAIIVAKNRHGETGVVDMRFIGKYQRFLPVDKTREDWRTVPKEEIPAPIQTSFEGKEG